MFRCEFLTRFQITLVWSEDILDGLSSLCVEGRTGRQNITKIPYKAGKDEEMAEDERKGKAEESSDI